MVGNADAPPTISDLRAGSLAAASSLLSIGDTLVAVNGVCVKGHAHGTALLRAGVGAIELDVRTAPHALSVNIEAAATLEATARAQMEQYRCPVTLEVMHDPVTTCDGMTYERIAITEWLVHHSTSPLTGAPLSSRTLTPNLGLKARIDDFFAKHPHLRSPPTAEAASGRSWAERASAPLPAAGKDGASDATYPEQGHARAPLEAAATPRTGGSRGGRRRGRASRAVADDA